MEIESLDIDMVGVASNLFPQSFDGEEIDEIRVHDKMQMDR
jgi:hypothetical protein